MLAPTANLPMRARTRSSLPERSSLPAQRSPLCIPRPGCQRQRAPRTHAAGVLRKQYSLAGQQDRLGHDQLEGLLVSQATIDALTKQLEKLNWAVYLVNERPSTASGKDDEQPEVRDEDYVYHFAYGANMNTYTLIRRDVKALSRDPAKLSDTKYRMVFKHRGGYATIEEVDTLTEAKYERYSRHVHGVLYRVSKADLKKLEQREGGYVLREMQVETYDNRVVTAWVFVSGRLSKLREEVAPTEKYMRKLREGASDNYLDPLYQAWLSSIDTVPSAGLPQEYWNTPSKYFAYGFLCIVACILSGFFFRQ